MHIEGFTKQLLNKLIFIFTIEQCLCMYLVNTLSYTVLHDLFIEDGVVHVLSCLCLSVALKCHVFATSFKRFTVLK